MSVANESRSEEHNMQEHHGSGRYWIVWGALLIFTIITVVTGRMHLPDFGLLLALVIATVKGTLVLLFFMHLVDHKGANRLVIGVSVLFVVLMIIAPMADFATRFRGANPPGSHLSDLPDLNFPPHKQPASTHGGQLKPPDTHP
ncbi:cytochrome C oxidase subunit IV family protein [Hyalangium rubrum]|uniref:Cytochrome C oxidase subunit IV family protein n=1 Tax=Hyalangium rubrum TaxID=3103134 RepID=A0ABU5HG38_9BACT|nr:cytochrome C oxidase subunit IV family protein [Hyalangium sp. s54d21]MDY7232104.1 cytochrome C oxidase subunit IV family protein [Hyalangium sp. s54d21]